MQLLCVPGYRLASELLKNKNNNKNPQKTKPQQTTKPKQTNKKTPKQINNYKKPTYTHTHTHIHKIKHKQNLH